MEKTEEEKTSERDGVALRGCRRMKIQAKQRQKAEKEDEIKRKYKIGTVKRNDVFVHTAQCTQSSHPDTHTHTRMHT